MDDETRTRTTGPQLLGHRIAKLDRQALLYEKGKEESWLIGRGNDRDREP